MRRATYFLIFAAIFLRLYNFGSIPGNFNCDELGSAYDGYCIAYYGVDRFDKSFPVYFANFGGGQSALMTYFCTLSIYFLGFNAVAIRLPALLNSLLFLFFAWKVIDEICREEKFLPADVAKFLLAGIYATSPYLFLSSRFSLDCNLFFGFSTLFVFVLIRAIKSGQVKKFFLAGIIGGVVFYTYVLSYLILPLFLILTLLYLIRTGKINFRNAAIFSLPLVIFAVPLILVQYVNYFDLPEMKIGALTITKLPLYRASEFATDNMMNNLFSEFKSVLFFDNIDFNTTSEYWNFYPVSVIFFFIGAGHCIYLTAKNISGKIFSGTFLYCVFCVKCTYT